MKMNGRSSDIQYTVPVGVQLAGPWFARLDAGRGARELRDHDEV
jgi:hypothetical protein